MEVGLTHLSGIGYIPSYKLKASKPIPKLLEDEASWYKLLEDVHNFIKSCKGKSGTGSVKPFFINIVDTTAFSDADSKVSVSNFFFCLTIYHSNRRRKRQWLWKLHLSLP